MRTTRVVTGISEAIQSLNALYSADCRQTAQPWGYALSLIHISDQQNAPGQLLDTSEQRLALGSQTLRVLQHQQVGQPQDVYKRQSPDRPGRRHHRHFQPWLRQRLLHQRPVRRAAGAMLGNTLAPVSYTHLDVYKRQA